MQNERASSEAVHVVARQATRSGGVVTPVALEPDEATLPVVDAATREVDIRGVFSYCSRE